MGWAVGFNTGHRWIGYGVPAICDHLGCGARIDRGLSHLCGDRDKGCGLFFCTDHLWWSREGARVDPQMCERCCDVEPPFEPTPDTFEWETHLLIDDSWEQWRQENPDKVAEMRSRISHDPIEVDIIDGLGD